MKVYIEFTAPNGEPVMIAAEAIEEIMPSFQHTGGALLVLDGGTQEVQQSQTEVMQILSSATRKFRMLSLPQHSKAFDPDA